MPDSRKRVLGVLGGEDLDVAHLAGWCASADVLLAADSGADRCLSAGYVPAFTVGDFDSLVNRSVPNMVHRPDQNSSDCDKLLAFARELGHSAITLAGVEGDRMDHILGSLSSAIASDLEVRFVFRRGIGYLVRSGAALRVRAGAEVVVSLLPLRPCIGVRFEGVHWPVADRDMSLGKFVSVSNRAEGDEVEVEIAEGCALLTVFAPQFEEPIWEPG